MQPSTLVTTQTFYSITNAPMIVALLFGFAGAVFLAIYILRRIRGSAQNDSTKVG